MRTMIRFFTLWRYSIQTKLMTSDVYCTILDYIVLRTNIFVYYSQIPKLTLYITLFTQYLQYYLPVPCAEV